MASLTDNKIKDTYVSLLKVSDNGELDANLQEITDGVGNNTGIQLNTAGDLAASGTVAFGSLKDTGENITITKFVDEADGISNNDNDSSIPTSAAVKDYVDTNITAQDLDITDGVNVGAVDLDSQLLTFTGDAGVSATVSGQTVTFNSSALQNQIDSNDGDITTLQAADVTLQNNIDAEESSRISADNTLQSNITAEATTRANADTALQNNIDAEAATRLANDNTLQTNIDNEESARISADTTLQSNIDSEASTRSTADTTLQNNINAEEAARIAADTTLQTNINTEASTRASADISLQNQITSNDGDITSLDTRLTTAEGNITSNDGDINALDGRLTTAEGDITAIEGKTDFITVTQSVNLDTLQGDVGANTSKLAGIENGADVTDATNVAAAGAMMTDVALLNDLADVSGTPTDGQVLAYDSVNGWQPVAPGAAPVDSVNGQTGVVLLDADDISDAATTNKFTTQAEIDKLAGIEALADVTDATNVTTALGSISVTAHSDVTSAGSGQIITTIERDKLAGIEAGAEVNTVNSVNTQTGAVVLDADDISDAATTNKFTTAADISKLAGIEAGADITDVANVTSAINSISVTAHSDVTSAGSGAIITSAERTKLNGIEAGADVTDVANVTTALNSISVTAHSDVTSAGSGQIITAAERTQLQGAGARYTVSVISANTTAVKDRLYVLTASLTLTLPASPSAGDKVAVSNMSGTVTPTIARNGQNIAGLAENLTIDVNNLGIQLMYSGVTKGWVIL